MFIFRASSIREVDPEGELTASGVRWTQNREWLSEPLMNIEYVLLLGICGAVFVGGVNQPNSKLPLQAAGLMLAAGLVLWLAGRWLCTAKCGLIFYSDGSIAMPYGRPGYLWSTDIQGDHRDIFSIEIHNGAAPSGPKRETCFVVCLYFTNGDVIPVAEAMTQWEAHKVAAMLTEARTALRSAQASLPNRMSSNAHGMRARANAVVIE